MLWRVVISALWWASTDPTPSLLLHVKLTKNLRCIFFSLWTTSVIQPSMGTWDMKSHHLSSIMLCLLGKHYGYNVLYIIWINSIKDGMTYRTHSSWRTTSAKIDIDSVSLMSDIVNTQSSIQFEKIELALSVLRQPIVRHWEEDQIRICFKNRHIFFLSSVAVLSLAINTLVKSLLQQIKSPLHWLVFDLFVFFYFTVVN